MVEITVCLGHVVTFIALVVPPSLDRESALRNRLLAKSKEREGSVGSREKDRQERKVMEKAREEKVGILVVKKLGYKSFGYCK